MAIDRIGGVEGAGKAGAGRPAEQPGRANAADFGRLLDAQLAKRTGELKFSGHAQQRLARRGITVDAEVLGRLDAGVGRAASKGGRDALVLVDDVAFVVAVRNRTVVTAVDREHMREQVFTNIDSAVIA